MSKLVKFQKARSEKAKDKLTSSIVFDREKNKERNPFEFHLCKDIHEIMAYFIALVIEHFEARPNQLQQHLFIQLCKWSCNHH